MLLFFVITSVATCPPKLNERRRKQSTPPQAGGMDCFAALAMTVWNGVSINRRHSGAVRRTEPGISRFRVWSYGPSRNDNKQNHSRGAAERSSYDSERIVRGEWRMEKIHSLFANRYSQKALPKQTARNRQGWCPPLAARFCCDAQHRLPGTSPTSTGSTPTLKTIGVALSADRR